MATLLAAASASADGIDWFPLVAGFAGGLGLFLLGLRELTDALKQIAGDRLRAALSRLTTNRFTGALTGAIVTAIVQSSSVTTVVAVGFVSAGVLGVAQAVSVVLGANVGTTITAQVISLDIDTWAFVLVAVGALGSLTIRRDRWRPRALALLGLGLVFIGMQVMSSSMAPLRESEGFLDLMVRLEAPLLGMLAGAVFCAVVQSSSATTAVAIALASEGLITLEGGVAVVIGANIGTCVTAGLAAIGRPRPAVRVAVAHVTINLLGALVWVAFVGTLTELARDLTSSGDAARQLANAHTLFNVSVAVAFLPFLGPLTRVLERLVPDRPSDRSASALDPALLDAPGLALAAVRVELGRLGDEVSDMVESAAQITTSGTWRDLATLAREDDDVDDRYRRVVEYLTELGQEQLTEDQTDELFALLAAADDIENIGDVVEVNLARLGQRRIEQSIRLDAASMRHIGDVAAEVARAVRRMAQAVGSDDDEAARDVVAMKVGLETLLTRAFSHQADALVRGGSRSLQAFALERDILESLRRIFDFAKRTSTAQLVDRATAPDVDVV